MKISDLKKSCEYFEKSAQKNFTPQNVTPSQKEKRLVLDPKKKNIDFWGNFLFNAIKSYALKFSSPANAKKIFENIASYNHSPAYMSNKEAQEVDTIATAIKESINKLSAAGLNPYDVLRQKGMTNINTNMLNILENNLKTMREARDFSKYQHYYLQSPGQPKEIIELDEPESGSNSPGY